MNGRGGIKVEHVNAGGRITLVDVLVLAGLLAWPVMALQHWGVDWRWVGSYAVAINALCYAAYAFDKKCAREKRWRLSEARLHLLSMLGGWPGAFLAQRRLRHKCSKVSFQFGYWLIVAAFQFAAFDSMHNWHYVKIIGKG